MDERRKRIVVAVILNKISKSRNRRNQLNSLAVLLLQGIRTRNMKILAISSFLVDDIYYTHAPRRTVHYFIIFSYFMLDIINSYVIELLCTRPRPCFER